MAKTVSFSVGRVAIMHDVRREISANVDRSLVHRNVVIVDELKPFDYDVEAYTNAKFQPVIDEYNAKQTREERKKNMTYTEIIAEENRKLIEKAKENKEKGIQKSVRKPTKLCHEYVFQVGDRDTNGTLTGDYEKNVKYAEEVIKAIEKKYPHAKVLLATLHADEPNGSIHCHILVQFEGELYKQGLSKQISMSKALELDGFERSQNRGDYAVNRWCKDIKETIMAEKLRDIFQEEVDIIGEHRKHDDVAIFREKAKRECEEMDRRRGYFVLENNDLENEKAYLESQIEVQKDTLKKNRDKLDWVLSRIKQGMGYVDECKFAEQRVKELEAKKRSFEGEIDDIERDLNNIKSLRNDLRAYINQKSTEMGYEVKQVSDNYIDDIKMVLQQTKDKLNKGNTEHHAPKKNRGIDR